MAPSERSGGLRTIFSFFLGLMLTVFVGVGVYTFHPPPESLDTQIRELSEREQAIRDGRPRGEMTDSEQEELQNISSRRTELIESAEEARLPWGRSTSIILVVFATLTMAISLVRADQLPVISNGLLLGGVFTMIYGVGWIAVTDTSITRFLVITAALAITLGLGYVRFVVRARSVPDTGDSRVPQTGDLANVERRVDALEERMNAAAEALGASAR